MQQNPLSKYENENHSIRVVDDKNIFLYPWSYHAEPLQKTILKLVNDDVKDITITLLSAEEFEFCPNEVDYIFNNKIKKKLVKKNIKMIFLFGSADLDYYKNSDYHKYFQPAKNMFVELWPTFWIHRTLASAMQSIHYFLQSYTKDFEKNTIKYPCVTLNHIAKYHRCLLIDLLAKHELLDTGAVSWHNMYTDISYEWRWSDAKSAERYLSDKETYLENNYSVQFTPPDEFFQSFMSIVSETSDQVIFITEKTATAILYKQPFLVQGAPGFHRYLESLGFELYDEIFDYSFDHEEDLETRTEMIVTQVKQLCDKNLLEMYKRIKPKLDHNFKKFVEIVQYRQHVPSVVLSNQYIDEHYRSDLLADFDSKRTPFNWLNSK
jgi:hypothetical protein